MTNQESDRTLKFRVIIVVLLVILFVMSIFLFNVKNKLTDYETQAKIDFHNGLLDLDNTFQNMNQLFSTMDFQDMSKQEFELFSLAIEQQVVNLELIEQRIVGTSSKFDSQTKKLFKKSINHLVSLIHDIEFIAGAILEEKVDSDHKNAIELKQALVNISSFSKDLFSDKSSSKLTPEDIEALTKVMEYELRGN